MGLANDADAVVDARLRVHGIERLRIVDASIMRPSRPATQHTTAMIAERGARMIIEDAR